MEVWLGLKDTFFTFLQHLQTMPNNLQFLQCTLFSLISVPLHGLLPVPDTPSWVWFHCYVALWVPGKDGNVSRDRQHFPFRSRPKQLRKCKNRDKAHISTGNEPLIYQKFQEISIGCSADGSRLKNNTESACAIHHTNKPAWSLKKLSEGKIAEITLCLEGQRQVVREIGGAAVQSGLLTV